jgi:hypothetical protein
MQGIQFRQGRSGYLREYYAGLPDEGRVLTSGDFPLISAREKDGMVYTVSGGARAPYDIAPGNHVIAADRPSEPFGYCEAQSKLSISGHVEYLKHNELRGVFALWIREQAVADMEAQDPEHPKSAHRNTVRENTYEPNRWEDRAKNPCRVICVRASAFQDEGKAAITAALDKKKTKFDIRYDGGPHVSFSYEKTSYGAQMGHRLGGEKGGR